MNDSILDCISDEQCWNLFYQTIEESPYSSVSERTGLLKFIQEKRYLFYADQIQDGSFFSLAPHKLEIPKPNSKSKRVVYAYKKDHRRVFRFLNYFLLKKYDQTLFSKNLYSYRSDNTIHNAILTIRNLSKVSSLYAYKVDIHSYFNSIRQDLLLSMMEKKQLDSSFIEFSRKLFTNKVKISHQVVDEYFGVIPGMSLSGFYADFYLSDLDEEFFRDHIYYFRYADDILVFGKTKKEILSYRERILTCLTKKGLTVNEKKEHLYAPGDDLDFLGFQLKNNRIDLSKDTIRKRKNQIHAYIQKKRVRIDKNQLTAEKALQQSIRFINSKFYGNRNDTISWLYWYLPLINTPQSLKEMDEYCENRVRYLVTGRNSKRNYKEVPYSRLKEAGFRPLVSTYFEQIEAHHQEKEKNHDTK